MTTIAKFGKELGEWADTTFPGHRTTMRCLLHLREEVNELIDAPDDRSEFADAFMLLLDAARKAGITPDDLIRAGYGKLEICRQRQWGPPDENGVIRHTKSPHLNT